MCGLRDKSTQKRLLLIKEPSFKNILDTALKCESADAHMIMMNEQSHGDGGVFQVRGRNAPSTYYRQNNDINTSNRVNNYQRRSNRNSGGRDACWRCGRRNHNPSECFFINSVCRKCNGKRHLQKVCRNKQSNPHPRNVRALDTDGAREDPNILQADAQQVNNYLLSPNTNYNMLPHVNVPRDTVKASLMQNYTNGYETTLNYENLVDCDDFFRH